MTATAGLTALGARAHCDRHSPGQRPNAEALVEWQSRLQPGRFVAASPAAPAAEAADEGRTLPPSQLHWQPPGAGAGATDLGSLRLWDTLPDEVEWIDLSLAVHRGGHWLRLQPELVDLADGSEDRLGLALPDEEVAALAAIGITLAALRAAAAQSGSARWVLRPDGLGAFVAGLLDLGWPRD